MKKNNIWFYPIIIIAVFLIFTSSCKKDDDDVKKTGVLKFKTLNPWKSGKKSIKNLKSILSNPELVGDTTVTHTTSFKIAVGDVWVSQGEVKVGNPDNLEWIRLTSSTNTELKLFEHYVFSPVELPVGTYKSIKITFRNIFYRYAQLVSNPSIAYELLETMDSYTTPCDENDTSWARTNYFSPDGKLMLNSNDVFEIASAGEKVAGFSIEAGKTAILSWRLGAGATRPCITYLIDANSNRVWDCGIDLMDFECPPENEYMFDFVVKYE
jgi:hypothetical protein